MDYILNGNPSGGVANRLIQNGFRTDILRPMLRWNPEKHDPATGQMGCFETVMTVNRNGKPEEVVVQNADATLRKEDWKAIDQAVLKAAQPRFKAFGDLRAAGLTYSIPNGMAKTVLETEKESDITDAQFSMDGLAEGQNDRPVWDIENLPLPIVHKDFNYSARQLAASRMGNSPLDTTSAELAGRKVAEAIEQLYIGTLSRYKYGGGTVWGLTNFPSRIAKTITQPNGSNQQTTLREVLDMKNAAKNAHHYGPFMLYAGTEWDPWLDDDFSPQYSGKTLRQRLGDIQGIDGVETLDFLPGYDLILVQKSTDVVRAVLGMDLTVVQWETKGGMQVNFKVMAIMVPQLRADYYGNTGIVHGQVS